MKITFDRQILLDALTPAMGCVSEKSTMPSIEGILINAVDFGVTLSSYDLEKGFRTTIEATVHEGGAYILDATKVYKIVRAMPEDSITFEVDSKNSARLTSGSSEFRMSALSGSEFPSIPDLAVETKYFVPQGTLKSMIGQVSHAIAQNDARQTLNGANFILEGGILRIISCDGNRLAIREKSGAVSEGEGEAEPGGQSFIIPGKTLSELQKILVGDDEPVGIGLGRKHIIFRRGETFFFSRIIDGDYLDIERVLPKGNKIKVLVWREALIESLERASLISDDTAAAKSRSFVKCTFEGNILKLSATATISSVYEEVPVRKTGDNITIGFNCRYLLDALKAASGDEIELSLFAPLTSVIITAANETPGESFLYMVCPVRMRD